MRIDSIGLFFGAVVLAGCVSAGTRSVFQETERTLTPRQARADNVAAGSDAPLEGGLTREQVVRVAVARDPELASLAHRARALVYAAHSEAALPPPEIEGQVWNLPIVRPYALGEASMYMVGVRQMIPAVGGLDGRARAMLEEARAVLAQEASREREVARSTSDVYSDLLAATLHARVHHAQMDLLAQMRDVAGARLVAGGNSLADVARIELEQARQQQEMVRYDGDAARARATLNVVLHRSLDAPLGEMHDLDAQTISLGIDELTARAERARGEVRAAQARARAADARVRASEADANWPTFQFGASYMQDPTRTPGFGLLASMSLPWLSGTARARVAQAREEAAAERAMADAAAWDARREVAAALGQLRTNEHSLQVLRSVAIPAAQRGVDAVRAAYVGGNVDLLAWLDATRTALAFGEQEADAVANLSRAAAVLDQAVGESLPRTPPALAGGAR